MYDGAQKVRVQVSWAGGTSEEADEKADSDSGDAAQNAEVQVRETEEQKGFICVRQSAGTAMQEQLHLLIVRQSAGTAIQEQLHLLTVRQSAGTAMQEQLQLLTVRQSAGTAMQEQLQLLIVHMELLVTQLVKKSLVFYGI
jgi:acetyl-CoA carboxylase beta subunit